MISFLKSMFSSKDIVESGINGLDKAFFTDQEKSGHLLEFIKATTPMAKSRRFIAVSVTLLWCLGVVVGGGLLLSGSEKFDELMEFMSGTVNQPFSIIIGFYFLAHVVKGIGAKQ